MSPHRIEQSRHLAMLRRAGDIMVVIGTIAAVIFIATMSGFLVGSQARDAVEAPGHPIAPVASGGTLASAEARPITLAQAVFVRQDVLVRDRVVHAPPVVRDGCGPRCAGAGTVWTRTSRERYWSRAATMPAGPRCEGLVCVE